VLLLAGLFAVTGAPPFGLFISEFAIVSGAIHEHHPWVAGAVVVLLAIIFVGIAAMIVNIAYGEPAARDERLPPATRERAALVVGPALLAGIVLLFGLYIPASLRDAVASAARSLGGSVP